MSKRPPVIQGGFVNWMHEITEGKRPLPTSIASKHHYVAQFQLAKFKGKGRLHQLDKKDGTCKVVTPKEAAWSSNLYTVESTTGEHDGVIEGFYAVAEGFAAPALKRFLADPANLSDRDRGDLAFLVAIQEQRTPGFLADQKETITHAGIAFLATELASMKGSKAKRRKAQEAYEALTGGGVRIIPPDQEILRLSHQMLAESSQIANFLPWTLLTATEGVFICSDRPLTMYDRTPPYPFSAPAWMSSPMVEATLPLSRDACLRIGPNQRERIGLQRTAKQVERINRRTYGAATRYVYGPSAKVLEDLYALAQAEPGTIPEPIKKTMILFEDPETADPKVGDEHVARGWPRYVPDPEGSGRMLSYEVLDSEDAARRSVAPRPHATLEGFKAGDMRVRRREGATQRGR